MKLERVGMLIAMAPLIERATKMFAMFGIAAELLIDIDDLPPDMRDIAVDTGDRWSLKVTDFYDALSMRYGDELRVLNMADPLPRRSDETEGQEHGATGTAGG